ncbi:MAG: nicotinate-nucleotide adenylyltransferase [Candidatus Omnitrophota bacterium]
MKIGILGGTFDPIHYGHLILGEQVLCQLRLDKVILVPAFKSPNKQRARNCSATHRFNMAKLAVADNPHFAVSDIEIKRSGTSYTVDTVRQIKALCPAARLFLLGGSDLVSELPSWKKIDEILKMAKFVLAKRPGYGKRLSGKNFLKINVAQVDISSSLIRDLVRHGRSIRYLTPAAVVKYIEKNKLYR